MAATDQQIANEARDSLLRILSTDANEMGEADRRLRSLEIDKLTNTITEFEGKAARSADRRILSPIRRVNI